EIQTTLEEIERIASGAEYAGRRLFDGTFQNIRLQVGTSGSEVVTIRFGDYRTAALGQRAEIVSTQTVSTDALAAGTVKIQGRDVPASQSDGVSTIYPQGSALAKAAAINQIEGATGVHAEALPAELAGVSPIADVNLDGT